MRSHRRCSALVLRSEAGAAIGVEVSGLVAREGAPPESGEVSTPVQGRGVVVGVCAPVAGLSDDGDEGVVWVASAVRAASAVFSRVAVDSMEITREPPRVAFFSV